MAGWEDELAVLLSELGVKQEEPQSPLQQVRRPMRSDVKQREQGTDALLWGGDVETNEDDLSVNDLEMMRREVETIINQVVLLMQRGDLEASLKEDIMVVLRTLRRRVPMTQQPATNDEAYLEAASAMLHFCRIILQLSEFVDGV